jgi:hypothetical protein
MMRQAILLTLLLALLSGCGTKPPPDPNDPSAVGIMQPEVLQRNLKWASDMVNERVARQEISEEEGKEYLAKYAAELVGKVDFKHMDAVQAWRYADIFRTAERWDLAKKALEMAVRHAKEIKSEDRRVNDTLRLAQAQAKLGDAKGAIATARSVFDARETDKAPILMSVLYEVAPAARGKGVDLEVAKLVEDAAAQHLLVVIDPNKREGQAFLATKWHHVRKAWELVVELYRESGREDLAEAAIQRGLKMMEQQGRL